MPVKTSVTLEQSDFEVLKETKSFKILDIQTEQQFGDLDIPRDLIKTSTPSLATNLKKEAQKEGLVPDSYEILYFLVLAKEEEGANELGFIENEDAILIAATDLGTAEVNGFPEYTLFLQGVLI